MGMTVPFSELKPGSFINLNRTGGTGHAVVFLAFIDINGNDVSTYGSNVAGFRYYSSQGGKSNGGFDYRCAFFRNYGTPTLSNGCKRDTGVYEPDYQGYTYFNSGVMYMPSKWLRTSWSGSKNKGNGEFFDGPWDDAYSFFDDEWMDGRTLDDDLYTTWMRPNGIAPGEWVSNKEALVDVSPAPALNEESEAEE